MSEITGVRPSRSHRATPADRMLLFGAALGVASAAITWVFAALVPDLIHFEGPASDIPTDLDDDIAVLRGALASGATVTMIVSLVFGAVALLHLRRMVSHLWVGPLVVFVLVGGYYGIHRTIEPFRSTLDSMEVVRGHLPLFAVGSALILAVLQLVLCLSAGLLLLLRQQRD